jgi:predicted kinase
MKNIQVLVGISNSGKSTYAHQEWLKDPLNTVVISRDNMRNLLCNYTDENIHEYYNHPDFNRLEKEITKYCNTLIYEAIEGNKTIILDNTHLDFKRDIKSLEYWNVEVRTICFDITLKEALTRNMFRNRKVDEQIIIKQYNKYIGLRENAVSYSFSPKIIKQDETLPKCWVFDIDNTLAHKGNRSPFDWKKVGEDTVDKAVGLLCEILQEEEQVEIIFCSGRDEVCRKETEDWIEKKGLNNFQDFTLLMRKVNDTRSDDIVKEELWEEIMKTRNIIALIDDRNSVCRHARALGFKVFQVEYGNF